jgi:Domain of unknown function (DUF4394)/Calx-beta domain/Glucodextranase, domain B
MRITSTVRRSWRGILVVLALGLSLEAHDALANPAYGVTEANQLVRFDTSSPGTVATVGPITGLLAGQQILALDVRPLTGRLYGVSTTHLYTIDPLTAAARLVSATPFGTLTGAVAMDFDPAHDMIRLVTDTNQNLRLNPTDGTATTDTNINPASQIAAIAYTNNFASPDRTTLYAIDANTNQLVRIGGEALTDGGASQNAGVVTTIGALGFDTSALVGLDITANDNVAYAAMAQTADPTSTLFSIDLATGVATSRGIIAATGRLRGFAVLTRAVTMYGLTSNNAIITFLSAVPGTLLPLGTGAPVPIAGLDAGETIIAIDMRPATGQIYGLSSADRLYVIDPSNGLASSPIPLPPPGPTGNVVGFDFNPVLDLARVITDTGQNLTVNPTTGAVTVQTALNRTTIVGLAYSNNVSGAASTTLYGIDEITNELVTFANPSNGVATTVGPMGTDVGTLTSFEISPVDGTAFAAITFPGGNLTTLYTVNLATGATRPINGIAGNFTLRGLAAASPGRLRFSNATYNVLENAGNALISVERTNGTDGPVTVTLQAQTTPTADATDFDPLTVTVEFLAGETSKTVGVHIIDDTQDDDVSTVNLVLSDPSLGATLATPTAATLSIEDNDPGAGGTTPTISITAPTADSTYTATSLFITLAGTANDPDGTIATVTWTNDRGATSGSASTGPAAQTVQWFANDVPLQPGVNTITVVATDNAGNKASDTIVVTVNDLSYYLAEGATGGFFDLDLLLANPNATTAVATVTYLKKNGGGTIVQHYTLLPTSRQTIAVDTVPGLEETELSTIVTVPAATPLIVERTMRWDSTGYGAHTEKASPNNSKKWYFAEGSQGFFFTYLLLANPENAQNNVSVTYFREGSTPITRQYVLGPLERFTVDIGGDAELVNNSFGMEVTFTLPGIAERAMYFGLSPLWIGGHEAIGVNLPSRNWFLAEGATGPFFETFVLFSNPSLNASTVDVRYLPQGSAPVSRTYTVPAQGRLTINIEQEDASLTNAAVGTEVTSSEPILVERAQYWPDPYTSWYEAHDSFGVTAIGTKWGLAEGRGGGSANYQTYILLANTSSSDASVTIQFLKEDGTTVTKTFTVVASSRLNVNVGSADVPEITSGSFGAVITSTQPIVVERAMYSDARGQTWQAGTNATGTRLP